MGINCKDAGDFMASSGRRAAVPPERAWDPELDRSHSQEALVSAPSTSTVPAQFPCSLLVHFSLISLHVSFSVAGLDYDFWPICCFEARSPYVTWLAWDEVGLEITDLPPSGSQCWDRRLVPLCQAVFWLLNSYIVSWFCALILKPDRENVHKASILCLI